MKEQFYLARDLDGALYLHEGKPVKENKKFFTEIYWKFNDELYPEIKPGEYCEVKLTLGKKNK